MTCAIETDDLTRRFGRTEAVKGLTLQVPAGTVFALLGPNGAGKTTTLKLLMNLLRATRGTATVLGTDTRRLNPRDLQRIGYVSENQRLPDWMTPRELFDYCRPFYPAWDEGLRRRLESDLALPSNARLRTLCSFLAMVTLLALIPIVSSGPVGAGTKAPANADPKGVARYGVNFVNFLFQDNFNPALSVSVDADCSMAWKFNA